MAQSKEKKKSTETPWKRLIGQKLQINCLQDIWSIQGRRGERQEING